VLSEWLRHLQGNQVLGDDTCLEARQSLPALNLFLIITLLRYNLLAINFTPYRMNFSGF
jgi:hypothetical protein